LTQASGVAWVNPLLRGRLSPDSAWSISGGWGKLSEYCPPALCATVVFTADPKESFPIGSSISLEELARDPYPTYARMQNDEPVSWVPVLGMYYIVRYEHVQAVLKEPGRFAVGTEHSTLFDTFGQHMLTVDGALHDHYRSAFQPHFQAGTLRNQIESRIRDHVDRLLDGFDGQRRVEARRAFASRLPILTMLSLLGLPLYLEQEMRHWYDSFEVALANFTWQADIRERAQRNVKALRLRVQEALEQYRQLAVPDALLSVLGNAPTDSALTDEAIQRNALIILFGGISTVEALILNSLFALSVSHETLERVRANHSLIPIALEETMRWSGPVQSATRHVVADTTFEGVEFKAGDVVNCMIAAANRDPRKFVDPHRFDITRSGLRQHLGFAIGAHHCLGSHLAKLEARIALEHIFARLPNSRVDLAEDCRPYGHEFRRPPRLTLIWD
jgi:cytochrome P450